MSRCKPRCEYEEGDSPRERAISEAAEVRHVARDDVMAAVPSFEDYISNLSQLGGRVLIADEAQKDIERAAPSFRSYYSSRATHWRP
ncbi:MAG: hypothetical protein M3198_15545 [Actinomycetota bacterium]|nr:hypothetical protein [Actinomycetota bacterium]